jgi:hypothetical protein
MALMNNNRLNRGALGMLLSCLICMVGCSTQRNPIESGQPVSDNKRQSMDKSESQQVAQATIDLEALQKYLHPDAPDRKPLRVLNEGPMSSEPPLTKFGAPVEYVSRSSAKASGKPYFEFTTLEISGNAAAVTFTYPVEGISGRVNLRRTNGHWQIENHSLNEK